MTYGAHDGRRLRRALRPDEAGGGALVHDVDGTDIEGASLEGSLGAGRLHRLRAQRTDVVGFCGSAEQSTFRDASLRGRYEGATFTDCDFVQASFVRATLRSCRFVRCNLSNAVFSGAVLDGVELVDCELFGLATTGWTVGLGVRVLAGPSGVVPMDRARLAELCLVDSDLSAASLRGAEPHDLAAVGLLLPDEHPYELVDLDPTLFPDLTQLLAERYVVRGDRPLAHPELSSPPAAPPAPVEQLPPKRVSSAAVLALPRSIAEPASSPAPPAGTPAGPPARAIEWED